MMSGVKDRQNSRKFSNFAKSVLVRGSRKTLGVSITNFGSAGAVYLSDSEHARKFLTRVNSCQCSYLHGIKVYFNLRRRCTSAKEQCRKRFNGQALECFTNSLSRL